MVARDCMLTGWRPATTWVIAGISQKWGHYQPANEKPLKWGPENDNGGLRLKIGAWDWKWGPGTENGGLRLYVGWAHSIQIRKKIHVDILSHQMAAQARLMNGLLQVFHGMVACYSGVQEERVSATTKSWFISVGKSFLWARYVGGSFLPWVSSLRSRSRESNTLNQRVQSTF